MDLMNAPAPVQLGGLYAACSIGVLLLVFSGYQPT